MMSSAYISPESNSEKKKGEDEGKSAASNGDTGQSTTPTSPTERGKGKLEKRKKGKDKSEKAEGRVIYDRVRNVLHVYIIMCEKIGQIKGILL